MPGHVGRAFAFVAAIALSNFDVGVGVGRDQIPVLIQPRLDLSFDATLLLFARRHGETGIHAADDFRRQHIDP
ncbi:hypothetical protein PsyrH_18890 [Pseudomonas syringae pv. syringae HS191]|uniref:LysR family transcriptional regulator n=1 Tax=Pseudomonas syringae TaxID=317 RepID=A0AB37ZUZ7_PSESX|nr:hypothetical protein PsyrH_18890 [Pseudomonas syringae pv. syringae HS191]KTC04720.1 hypothetical protein AO388_24850 [Pseudomonas sp. ICMP 10191]SDH30660.1 hypothetical protein SAMN05444503_103646 [Pseudomonas sp. BS3767]SDM60549.1 hypothetical protein SAMN05444502_102134 [Pseudomonas sp. BS3759]SDO22248.1 hypothetical protein SAMN05444505_1196 [Pseudomonas syringae]